MVAPANIHSKGSPLQVSRLGGALFIVLSAAGFGALAIFGKVAFASGVTIEVLLLLRFLTAGLLMVGLMRLLRLPWPKGRDLLLLCGMGAIGYVGQAFCYFSALKYASAGLTALLLYLYPALVTLTAAALGRQRLTFLKLSAVAATLLGIFLTVADGLSGSLTGILYGIAAAVIYTGYILVGEVVIRRTGAIPAATVIMLAAATVFGCALLFRDACWPSGITAWGAVAGIALFSTVIPIVGFFAGMQRLGAADAATLSTLEPVVTLALAAVILGETLVPLQLAGAILILGAVIVLARAK